MELRPARPDDVPAVLALWRAAGLVPSNPDHRRKGIALKLVARAERRIAALGGRRISSIVVDGDEHAVAFWRAAGCERDHRVSRFVKSR